MVLNGFNQLQQGWAINKVNGFVNGEDFCLLGERAGCNDGHLTGIFGDEYAVHLADN